MIHQVTSKRNTHTPDEGRTLAWLMYLPRMTPAPHIATELHYLAGEIDPMTWNVICSKTLIEWAAGRGAEAVIIRDDETGITYRVAMADLLDKGFRCVWEGRHVILLELNDWTQVLR